MKHKDAFDEYNIARVKKDMARSPDGIDGDWIDPTQEADNELDLAEKKKLANILQSSDTDIMEIANMTGDDIIANSPRTGERFGQDLWDFLDLVQTKSAPDVKNRTLNDAIGATGYDHLYSIWSRGWYQKYWSRILGRLYICICRRK